VSGSGLIASYREFVPCKALQDDVYAVFSFVPSPSLALPRRPLRRAVAFRDATFCSPQFADGHVSILFELGRTCHQDGVWRDDTLSFGGTVTGPMTGVGRTEGTFRPEMIGVYFRPARVDMFFHVAISALTDHMVAIEDLWGASSVSLCSELRDLDEEARVDRLESALLTHLRAHRGLRGSLDIAGLAAGVIRQRGRVTVGGMARAAGVSRQHLTRQFREWTGIRPKLYIRLARFHSALAYAGARDRVDWASAAIDMGYADQSHMIAECREFSSLTPQALASRDWFHPFIERARSHLSSAGA
jgi:AraC-like DNA-binding protein